MRLSAIALKSLTYHRRSAFGVWLGSVICTGVIVGAFVVGDSVRYSLKRLTEDRLGRIRYASATGSRLFRAELASDLGHAASAETAAAIAVDAVGVANGGARRANRVRVVGIDAAFGDMFDVPPGMRRLDAGDVWINRRLADELELQVGDGLLLRLMTPARLPYEAVLSSAREVWQACRVTVRGICADRNGGRFSLKTDQTSPSLVYADREWLAAELGVEGQANLLLVGESPPGEDSLAKGIAAAWRPADAGLAVVPIDDAGRFEIRHANVFIPPPVLSAIRQAFPKGRPVLTYFVNSIESGTNRIPYSFVAALDSPETGTAGREGLVLNEWAATDLGASVGDEVRMSYYVKGNGASLIETSAVFRLGGICVVDAVPGGRALMPAFPGLAGAEQCRDWDPGVPVDLSRVRKRDEAYWDEYGGTPKGFLPFSAGETLWGNRFGNATAVRVTVPGERAEDVGRAVLAELDPAVMGLSLRPVRREGLKAGEESVDFGQLFVGLSFFVVAAALILMGLLFVFGMETRLSELALMRAVGFRAGRIRRLFIGEAAALVLTSLPVGALMGIGYNRLIVTALRSVWRGAVADASLTVHSDLGTVAASAVGGGVVAVIALAWVVWRAAGAQIAALQAGSRGEDARRIRKRSGWAVVVGSVLVLAGVGLVLYAVASGRHNDAGMFFGAGGLLLSGCVGVAFALFSRASGGRHTGGMGLWRLSVRGAMRRATRSTAVIGLLACGIFLVTAVSANRKHIGVDPRRRDAPTGGFALYAESTLPVFDNLNDPDVRERLGLDADLFRGVAVVPMRATDGDDASCLNLARVRRPRILGVDPEMLQSRGAFRFSSVSVTNLTGDSGWAVLSREAGPGRVPAVADEPVIIWSLGLKPGGVLKTVSERGQPFDLWLAGALAGSILQGNVVISDSAFRRLFPSAEGFRVFLIDAPAAGVDEVAGALERALEDVGFGVQRAVDRMAEFNRVENTYLSVFLVLGGLGLVLGSAGVAVVLLRTVLERRGELALMRSVGFARRRIYGVIWREHLVLLLAGTAIGSLCGLVATVPSLLDAPQTVPLALIAAVIAGVLLNGLLWTTVAALRAASGDVLGALRQE